MNIGYPDTPGFKVTTPETSLAAAVQESANAPTLRDLCLDYLRGQGPLTADELAEVMGRSVLAIRPRISELHALGKVEDTHIRRFNASGKKAVVWGPTSYL